LAIEGRRGQRSAFRLEIPSPRSRSSWPPPRRDLHRLRARLAGATQSRFHPRVGARAPACRRPTTTARDPVALPPWAGRSTRNRSLTACAGGHADVLSTSTAPVTSRNSTSTVPLYLAVAEAFRY